MFWWFILDGNPENCQATTSVDAEDLLSLLPGNGLVKSARMRICDCSNECRFNAQCGIPVGSFIRSTVLQQDSNLYTQKIWVCIGFRVAKQILSCVDRQLGLMYLPCTCVFLCPSSFLCTPCKPHHDHDTGVIKRSHYMHNLI